MWQERNKPKHFTYSGVMSWLALDRAIKSIKQHGMGGPHSEWEALREKVRQRVEEHGYNTRVDSFTQHYGTRDLDASVHLLPIVGFLSADDPRMLSTVKSDGR